MQKKNFVSVILLVLLVLLIVAWLSIQTIREKRKRAGEELNDRILAAKQIESTLKPKIVIITEENRPLNELINIHNTSLRQYCDYHGYEYRFTSTYKSDSPVYWHKIEWVKDILENEKVDYVLWLDSDTLAVDKHIPLTAVIACDPRADVYIGLDGDVWHVASPPMNAGIFMVKNSEAGRGFLNACLDKVKSNKACYSDGKIRLNSRWAGDCYEQGVMNRILRVTGYAQNVCIVRPPLFNNGPAIGSDVRNSLFVHRYGNKDQCVKLFKTLNEETEKLPVVPNQNPLRVCILLTMYGEQKRRPMYSQVLQKWASRSSLPIFIVDSCGENLFQDQIDSHFRYFQYHEPERDNISLAEISSIERALKYYGFDITKFDLICKVTGKYWIPDLEKILHYIPEDAELVLQHRQDTHGQNSEVFAIRPSAMSNLIQNVQQHRGMERGLKALRDSRQLRKYRFPFLKLDGYVERSDKSKINFL